MRTRLLTLACEQTINKQVRYYLVQQADITSTGGQYGGSSRVRVSKTLAHKLLGFGSEARFGTAPMLASVMVVIP